MSSEFTKEKVVGTFAGVLLGVPLVAVVIVITGYIYALVQYDLWKWFVVPYFGLPQLPVWEFWGLSIFVGTFVNTDGIAHDKAYKWWMPFVRPVIVLGVGYLIHHFALS